MKQFWAWYERHLLINTAIAAGLFLLQIIHLVWLTLDIVIPRLGGVDLWNVPGLVEWAIILVDYTEIPALITTSILYINQIRKKSNFKSWLYLFFLNVQFIHIFWITDEFVVSQFSQGVQINPILAWVAIFIDYLELPVIWETLQLFFSELKKGNFNGAREAIKST